MTAEWINNLTENELKRERGLIYKHLEEGVKREKGYLYFVGKDGFLWAAPMKNNPTGVKKKVGTRKLTAKESELFNYCLHLR